MPISKDESFELAPNQFVRGSKMRKSFRIRHRYNPKLPPAAVLFMKSLEQNKVSNFDTIRSRSVFYTTSTSPEDSVEDSVDLDESYDPLVEEEQPLIMKTPVLRRRNSYKKYSGSKKLKMNSIISFFRKV
jgi:hypothetical protein